MSGLTIQFESREDLQHRGPVVDVVISSGRTGVPPLRGPALIDTGASATFVPPETVEAAGLIVVAPGDFLLSTVNDGGRHTPIPIYAAEIMVEHLEGSTITQCYGVSSVPGNVIALLGRDLLRRGKFEYDGLDARIRLNLTSPG